MSLIITLVIVFVVLSFGVVILFGAPYLPTKSKQRKEALKLLDLKKGEMFFELGCGDGTLLVMAAQQGLKVTGYELNPLLWLICRLRTRRYGSQVKVILGNYWRADLSKADGIYVFLIDHFMPRLDQKLRAYKTKNNIKLVSFAFPIPGKNPKTQKDGLFLYKY